MINIDSSELRKLQKRLADVPKGVEKAVTRGINRALAKGRTEIVRAVTADYLIKPGDVRATLSVRKASYGSLDGSITSSGPNIPLYKFQITPRAPQYRRRQKSPITARVKAGGGGVIPPAFVAGMASGNVGVYARTGSSRLPIKHLHTIGAPIMAGVDAIADKIEEAMRQAYETEVERQVKLLTA